VNRDLPEFEITLKHCEIKFEELYIIKQDQRSKTSGSPKNPLNNERILAFAKSIAAWLNKLCQPLYVTDDIVQLLFRS